MLHYCRATKAHYRSLSAQPVDQMFNSMDLIHAGPSFDEYRIVVSEIEKAPIPVHVMPLLFHDKMRSLFEMEDDSVELEVWSTRMQEMCQDAPSRLKFVNTRLDTIDGLWRELQREPKSFAVTCPEFPTLILEPGRHEIKPESRWTSPLVSNIMLLSLRLNRPVSLPTISSGKYDANSFLKLWSWAHEMLHVIQRVFRIERMPCYSFVDLTTGRTMHRNLDTKVAVGIQDELEVQEIMSRAFPDYGPPDLGATLSHIKYEKQEWKESGIDQKYLHEMVTAGLAKIDFRRFELVFPGVEEQIRELFREELSGCVGEQVPSLSR